MALSYLSDFSNCFTALNSTPLSKRTSTGCLFTFKEEEEEEEEEEGMKLRFVLKEKSRLWY
jgi:hypothetical protein